MNLLIAAHQTNFSNFGHLVFLTCLGIFGLWLLIAIIKKFR